MHKGGLFGSDYRMLFPGDGIPGIKRFFVDTVVAFGHRGLSCPPVIVGVGIGGTKDQCVTLGKEASCLRLVGDRHPDPLVADLEEELLVAGQPHHAGDHGLPQRYPRAGRALRGGLHPHRRAARWGSASCATPCAGPPPAIYGDGRVEYREDPQWFTPYYRREGVDLEPDEAPPRRRAGRA